MYERPYWYTYGDVNFEGGAYFGRWCVKAVAAVKPSAWMTASAWVGTLPRRPAAAQWPQHPPPRPDDNDDQAPTIHSPPAKSWWQRLLGR
jgi:hypothetical protein